MLRNVSQQQKQKSLNLSFYACSIPWIEDDSPANGNPTPSQNIGPVPNYNSYVKLLQEAIDIKSVEKGRQIHAHLIVSGFASIRTLANMLVNAYGKCGLVKDARQVFDRMPEREAITWTTMLTGYAQNGPAQEALKLFRRMHRARMKLNQFTFASTLKAASAIGDLASGKQVHCCILKAGYIDEIFVGSALVDMYGKNRVIDDASQVFDEMPEWNVVTWSGLITGYTLNGRDDDAFRRFSKGLIAGLRPNDYTLSTVIAVCANVASLGQGRQTHALSLKFGFSQYCYVGSAFVSMYARCGRVTEAKNVFDGLQNTTLPAWNSMIRGLAHHGQIEQAIGLFDGILKAGLVPDGVTFLCLISACSHGGLIEKGKAFYKSMIQDFGISPQNEHYASMVDLFARSGYLKEAYDFISSMPVKPIASAWGALLGACKMHGNPELGALAANKLLEMVPKDSGGHTLLSNIYAAAERWDDVAKVRKMMKERGVRKETGLSWVELRSKVHVFSCDDRTHPNSDEIFAKLEELNQQLQTAGYVPDTSCVLHGVKKEQKKDLLCFHSERLAVAFMLISTPPEAPIIVKKNIRVCGDCHTAIKFISKLTKREINVRDTNRFHHFSDGGCSCGDFW